MFYFDSLSQLAKYLPGGIWHLVSRGGFYRTEGLALRKITQALAIENIWLLSGACIVGLWGSLIFHMSLPAMVFIVITLFYLWWGGLWLLRSRFTSQATTVIPRRRWRITFWNLVLQISLWSIRGLSLWIIIPDVAHPRQAALVVGAFCLGWALGYVTLFAPGGIGIRESVIVFLLAPILNSTDSLLYASIHRFLWTAIEISLGLVAAGISIRHKGFVVSRIPDDKYELCPLTATCHNPRPKV
jgi:succinate dehydrogenase hydrophobic anchor subunit